MKPADCEAAAAAVVVALVQMLYGSLVRTAEAVDVMKEESAACVSFVVHSPLAQPPGAASAHN
jgi:hypothetical protein